MMAMVLAVVADEAVDATGSISAALSIVLVAASRNRRPPPSPSPPPSPPFAMSTFVVSDVATNLVPLTEYPKPELIARGDFVAGAKELTGSLLVVENDEVVAVEIFKADD